MPAITNCVTFVTIRKTAESVVDAQLMHDGKERHMNLTRREALALLAAAGGAGVLSGCSGADGGHAASQTSLAPSKGYAKNSSADLPIYQAKGRDLIGNLGPFDKVTQSREVKGRVEQLTYETHSYVWEEEHSGQEFMVQKSINVWLPADYDPMQTYDVLYLLHGTGHEGVGYWLTDEPDCHGSQTRGLLDGMVADGLIGNVIVATPSYYSFPAGEEPQEIMDWHIDPLADKWPKLFWRELRESVIPLVESTYPTHASGNVSEESLVASRDHRAFAGLSRGSMTSVNSTMLHCLDLFGWIGSYSGVWADFDEFRSTLEGQFANYPVRYWYNGNGSKDFSLQNHAEFRDNVLGQMPDRFVDGQNYAWIEFPGGDHAYDCWALDLYNSLLAFF